MTELFAPSQAAWFMHNSWVRTQTFCIWVYIAAKYVCCRLTSRKYCWHNNGQLLRVKFHDSLDNVSSLLSLFLSLSLNKQQNPFFAHTQYNKGSMGSVGSCQNTLQMCCAILLHTLKYSLSLPLSLSLSLPPSPSLPLSLTQCVCVWPTVWWQFKMYVHTYTIHKTVCRSHRVCLQCLQTGCDRVYPQTEAVIPRLTRECVRGQFHIDLHQQQVATHTHTRTDTHAHTHTRSKN